MELNPKFVDFAFLATPTKTRSGFVVHAEFTLLVFPLRIEGCKLVKTPKGGWLIWTADARTKIMRHALRDLTALAVEELEKARERVAA
ncbi:hypothetical protein [Mameliella sp.]|uniref:hypothetical protein n=1 Tax=Mameliella sp. TaxID=1924940 RepID=UPI003BA84ACF